MRSWGGRSEGSGVIQRDARSWVRRSGMDAELDKMQETEGRKTGRG